MKKTRLIITIIALAIVIGVIVCSFFILKPKDEIKTFETKSETGTAALLPVGDSETEKESEDPDLIEAEYLGIKDMGSKTREDVLAPGSKVYAFRIDGEEKLFSIKADKTLTEDADADSDGDGINDYYVVYSADENGYSLQNKLFIGYTYKIKAEDDEITYVSDILPEMGSDGFVSNVPGERSVRNFLKTALSPMGSVLYVYGGGWDFQDIGSSDISRKIGISKTWKDFYSSKNEDYWFDYIEGRNDPNVSFYPVNGYNNWFFAGLDCSGYLGWVLYNTMYTDSFAHPGFVMSSTKFAKSLQDDYSFGSFNHISGFMENGENCSYSEGSDNEKYFRKVISLFAPGDIVSIPGHVYIVVGTCSDGSAVILHSSLTLSKTAVRGGGVMLSAISPKGKDDKYCEAYKAVESFVSEHKDKCDFYERYDISSVDPALYLVFPDEKESTGIFTWKIGSEGLSDEEGMLGKTAVEVLASLAE